jgi:hypothetical protein
MIIVLSNTTIKPQAKHRVVANQTANNVSFSKSVKGNFIPIVFTLSLQAIYEVDVISEHLAGHFSVRSKVN